MSDLSYYLDNKREVDSLKADILDLEEELIKLKKRGIRKNATIRKLKFKLKEVKNPTR